MEDVEQISVQGHRKKTASDREELYEKGSTNGIAGGWSLVLIGNASDRHLGFGARSPRGVFDKETRRKPLAFAVDAVRYGISTAVWVARAL